MKGSARINDGHTKGAYLYQKPSYMQGGKAYKEAQGADGSVGLSGDDMESDASVTAIRGSQRIKTGWGGRIKPGATLEEGPGSGHSSGSSYPPSPSLQGQSGE